MKNLENIEAFEELLGYFHENNCQCMECRNRKIEYPFPLGPVTEFCRSYANNHQVTFITNYNCNINCRHCFCSAPSFGDRNRGFVSKEIIDKTYEIIGDRKFLVSILGGEVSLYPENCKYIADEAHKRGLSFRFITNGWFGADDEKIDYLINEIKPEIITISVDEYHQEFIPIETIKHLIDRIYGKMEILIESCCDIKESDDHGTDFKWDKEPIKLKIAKSLGIENKKIFYLIDAIKKDGNARENNLGYEKFQCKEGYCSTCGFVVTLDGNISPKCEFNSRPINQCKVDWYRKIMTDPFDLDEFFAYFGPKRYWLDENILTEIDGLLNPERWILVNDRDSS
jgi:organic radical activating enzyme